MSVLFTGDTQTYHSWFDPELKQLRVSCTKGTTTKVCMNKFNTFRKVIAFVLSQEKANEPRPNHGMRRGWYH